MDTRLLQSLWFSSQNVYILTKGGPHERPPPLPPSPVNINKVVNTCLNPADLSAVCQWMLDQLPRPDQCLLGSP